VATEPKGFVSHASVTILPTFAGVSVRHSQRPQGATRPMCLTVAGPAGPFEGLHSNRAWAAVILGGVAELTIRSLLRATVLLITADSLLRIKSIFLPRVESQVPTKKDEIEQY
jgi:hypothetical protein